MYTLFRDDDISVTSNITLLKQVHNHFVTYNKMHTVAVLMKDLWENKEVWYWLMTAENLEIGLHGWEHSDYGKMSPDRIRRDIENSLWYWKERIAAGKYPYRPIKVFYPPWNSTSQHLESVCEEFFLKVDSRVGGEVYNFHYWALQDFGKLEDLKEALIR